MKLDAADLGFELKFEISGNFRFTVRRLPGLRVESNGETKRSSEVVAFAASEQLR